MHSDRRQGGAFLPTEEIYCCDCVVNLFARIIRWDAPKHLVLVKSHRAVLVLKELP